MMTREEILKAEEIYVSDFGLMIPMVLKNVGYIFDKIPGLFRRDIIPGRCIIRG